MQSQQIIIIGVAVIVSVIAGILIGSSMNFTQDIQPLENQYALDANTVYEGCSPPSGYVDNDDDCDDIDSFINPMALEFCDFVDNESANWFP